MKKIGVVIMVIALLVSLCACGSQKAATAEEAMENANGIVESYDEKWDGQCIVKMYNFSRQVSDSSGEFMYLYEIDMTVLDTSIDKKEAGNMVKQLSSGVADAFTGYDCTVCVYVYNLGGKLTAIYVDGELYE